MLQKNLNSYQTRIWRGHSHYFKCHKTFRLLRISKVEQQADTFMLWLTWKVSFFSLILFIIFLRPLQWKHRLCSFPRLASVIRSDHIVRWVRLLSYFSCSFFFGPVYSTFGITTKGLAHSHLLYCNILYPLPEKNLQRKLGRKSKKNWKGKWWSYGYGINLDQK